MEGRRKEVLLLVLAVVALGVAFYTFRKPSAPMGPAPTAGQTEGTRPGAKAGAPAATEEQAKAQPGTAPAGTAAGEQRNPFIAPGGQAAAAQPAARPGTSGAAASAAAGQSPAVGEPGAQPTPKPAVPQPEGEPAKPSFALTGIVRGRPDVAILRQDDRRYFVKVGETVDGYRVQSISSQQVVLATSQGKVTLRMGSGTGASQSTKGTGGRQ